MYFLIASEANRNVAYAFDNDLINQNHIVIKCIFEN